MAGQPSRAENAHKLRFAIIGSAVESLSTAHPDGRRDLELAADDLAQRLPEALAPLARLAFNYRWSWLPGGPRAVRLAGPRPLRALPPEPGSSAVRAARGQPAPGRRRRRVDSSCRRAGSSARRRTSAVLTSTAHSMQSTRWRSCARSTASMCLCPSTRAALARWPVTCSRRRPIGRCRWWRSASCTARATSASASMPRAGSTSTGSTPTPSASRPRSSPPTQGRH